MTATLAGERTPRRTPAICGTDGGYHRHLRQLGEPACSACRSAHSAAELRRVAARNPAPAATRPVVLEDLPDDGWAADAACRGMPPGFFYPGPYDIETRAPLIRQLCATCPVRAECLTVGLHFEKLGWWGGVGPNDRKALRDKLGIRLRRVDHEPSPDHGTDAAYTRHRKQGTDPCDRCRLAHAQAAAIREERSA